MTVIDADTHVIESEATWEYFPSDRSLTRPYLVVTEDPQTGDATNRWVIDGNFVPKPEGKGAQRLATPPLGGPENAVEGGVTWAWRSLDDTVGRLADAKRRGVDVQVVLPTLFLADLTEDPLLQVA